MEKIFKYPRTYHVEGSKKQIGDEDLEYVSLKEYADYNIVLEEKLDGANSGISFSQEGKLLLQSRGHFLTGGYRERHFNLFKSWAYSKQSELYELLGKRYIMYGEWLYAKHTIFYTKLPHYFLEFDIFDKERKIFLNTQKRREMLKDFPFIVSVPVLYEGSYYEINSLDDYVGQSLYIDNNHLEILKKVCQKLKLNYERVLKETDNTTLSEGLYIKVEDEEKVVARLKYVRSSFLTTVIESETHWIDRPIIPNQLASGVSIF